MSGWMATWRRAEGNQRNNHQATAATHDSTLWRSGGVAMGPDPLERLGVVVTFHGELYNSRDMRRRLERDGAPITTTDPRELLALGLRTWGFEPLLQRLDGLFSFALWDKQARRLYLARDPVGGKSLYYTLLGNSCTVGTDLRSVSTVLGNRREPETGMLPLFLYHGFIPAPWTACKDIWKLPPATAAIIRQRGRTLEKTEFTYWRLHYEPDPRLTRSEALEGVDDYLRKAVEKRMDPGTSSGLLLSGGVNSAALLPYAAEMNPGLRTFSARFTDQDDGGLLAAREAARVWNTEHHEEILSLDIPAHLTRQLGHYGEPLADPSTLLSKALTAAAGRHGNVILTGHGGREAFAGSSPLPGAWLGDLYKQLVALSWRERFERVATGLVSGRRLPPAVDHMWALLRYGAMADDEIYLDPDIWRDDLRRHLLTPEIKRHCLLSPKGWHARVLETMETGTALDARRALYTSGLVPNRTLPGLEMGTGVAGVKARFPFLDVDLLRFTATIPRRILLPWGEPEGLLKRSAARGIPPSVVYRQNPAPTTPSAYLSGPLRKQMEAILLSPRTLERGCFVPETIIRTVHEHVNGHFDHSARLWTLLVWEEWCRQYLDPPAEAADPIEAALQEAA